MRFLDYEGLGFLINELKAKFVQEQAGKGLTENDFTNILKTKLDGIEAGAQTNTVNSVNGKVGEIVITSNDIEFLSSVAGSTPTTVRAIVDNIIAKDKAQDQAIADLIESSANTDYVDGKLATKVDKVTGKGLTTNDFTTALKDKLEAIEAGAQVNKIELIKRNGTNLTITGKSVDIDVPTKLSQLTNDKTYQTQAEVQSLIADQGRLKKEIVTVLPSIDVADDNTMYMIRNKQNTGYEEWMAINGAWEILGDTAAIDFTGYIHQDDISKITNAEIDTFLNA